MLSNAFRMLLKIHSRPMTITRPGGSTANVHATPSNYSRNLAGPSETVIKGREFVMSKKELDDVSFGVPKRGDYLSDTDLGKNVISEVREMHDLGGAIIGYRIRTS